jgi:hypothetical protein
MTTGIQGRTQAKAPVNARGLLSPPHSRSKAAGGDATVPPASPQGRVRRRPLTRRVIGQTPCRVAVAMARRALEEFNREPLVASKRGGPRLSPWWRVYVQASEVAVRWCRQLEREDL